MEQRETTVGCASLCFWVIGCSVALGNDARTSALVVSTAAHCVALMVKEKKKIEKGE